MRGAVRSGFRGWASPCGAITFLALSFWLFEPVLSSGRCGVFRWDVKTGTDSGASAIDVTNPTDTTIANLGDATQFPRPNPFPPANRVAPAETTVWRVEATLDEYKWENDPTSGDSDYHLALVDDSGNHIVSEIPDPACSQGSAFLSQITDARNTFDGRLTATSSFKPGNVRVRITGVGFFDTAAHGGGHSPNGMEIHPILKIEFLDGSGPPPPPPPLSATTQLLVNPGFEDGNTGWTTSPGVISNKGVPHGGSFSAWLCGYGSKHTDTLSQTVSIPATASTASLSFFLTVQTDEIKPQVFDTLTVQVTDSGGTVPSVLGTFSNMDAASGYAQKTFDLSSFKGQTVQLSLVGKEDPRKTTSFFVDDFSLTTN